MDGENRGMNQFYRMYEKKKRMLEAVLFPLLLTLYPLIGIRQGLDVSDTLYSLSNFQYFTTMDGTWMVATFLANVLGSLLMCLPFGGTLIGMYFYTSLLQSVTAVLVYRSLKKRMPAVLVFAGEMAALGLCWCPSVILYNYLTYLLMSAGMLLLYEGILQGNAAYAASCDAQPQQGTGAGGYRYYVLAGVCLGANAAVRMPNVVQAALIVAVWYSAFACGGRWRRVVRDTLWCVSGYAAGFGIPFGAVCIRYGIDAYPSMVRTMFAMTEKATDYKPSSMLTGMLKDYGTGLYWLVFAGICMAGGWLLFAVQRRWFAGNRLAAAACKAVYAAVFVVLLRFYWGRGMFNFHYYEYRSMYYPTVLLLIVTLVMAVICLVKKGMPAEARIMAVLVLVQISVTPLGSNNWLYPIINCLFVAAPFVLWCGDLWGTQSKRMKQEQYQSGDLAATEDGAGNRMPVDGMVWKIPFYGLLLFVLVQSIGFHLHFSFQDGIFGEKRDTMATVPHKAAGVYTTNDNADWLAELAEYVQDAGLTGREVILYGEIPGLGYLLDMPPALSTFWPDLDSYRMVEYERDLAQLNEPPVIIVASPVAAYLGEDADGMNWFGVEQEKMDADEKLQILKGYMEENGYQERFGNGRYVVYTQ